MAQEKKKPEWFDYACSKLPSGRGLTEHVQYPSDKVLVALEATFKTKTGRALELDKLNSYTATQQPAEHPIFVLNFGPPGSGKSTLFSKVRDRLLGIDESQFVNLNIDTIIEDTAIFKNRAKQWIAQQESASESKKSTLDMNQVYLDMRSQFGNIVFDNLMKYAFQSRLNNSYETTASSVSWLMTVLTQALRAGYLLVLVWPVVDEQELVTRVHNRALETGRVVPKEYVHKSVANASKAFEQLLPMFDHVYLFDNSKMGKTLSESVLFQRHAKADRLEEPTTECDLALAQVSLYNQDEKTWSYLCRDKWTTIQDLDFHSLR